LILGAISGFSLRADARLVEAPIQTTYSFSPADNRVEIVDLVGGVSIEDQLRSTIWLLIASTKRDFWQQADADRECSRERCQSQSMYQTHDIPLS
jgi:hypothetical protein